MSVLVAESNVGNEENWPISDLDVYFESNIIKYQLHAFMAVNKCGNTTASIAPFFERLVRLGFQIILTNLLDLSLSRVGIRELAAPRSSLLVLNSMLRQAMTCCSCSMCRAKISRIFWLTLFF